MSRSETGTTRSSIAPARREAVASRPAEVQKLEREVARLEHALLEQARRAETEREAERESIARELHDRFGQYLTVLEMELGDIAELGDAADAVRTRLRKLKGLTAEARQDMSNLAWQIRPGLLPGVDLDAACVQLTEEWNERAGLAFDLHLSLGSCKLPPLVELTLYRVLQEALTNVAKHAGATRVGIILRAAAHQVMLVVEDNGSGFAFEDCNDSRSRGATLGLRGIRERLALVSGTLEIETSPGHGTTLLVSVPL